MANVKKVNKNCGSRLANARKDNHLTQSKLAEKVNVDSKYISALENNRRNMSIELAMDFEKILKVRHEYLLGIDDHPTSVEQITAMRYSSNDMMDYLEFFERNDYILSTPFGDDGDTASLTFLSQLTDIHIFSHNNEHFKCTNAQLHTFFQNSHQIIETLKIMLVRQFLETACIPLSESEYQSEMDTMMQLFTDKNGQDGMTWLTEQRKFDQCQFEDMDKVAWSESMKVIGTSVLKGLTPDNIEKLAKLTRKK
jgi:transcriptional regulator with XRE-family HTH domain